VQVHYYAMEGLKQLFETCEIIQEHFHPCKVKITGLLLTFVEDRLIFTRQIQQQMREFFGDLVFDTVIHRNIRLAEAPSAGQSVITYAPDSKGAHEYLALVDEIMFGKEYIRSATPRPSDAETEVHVEAGTTSQPSGDMAAQQTDVSTKNTQQTTDNGKQADVIEQPAVVIDGTEGSMPTGELNNG
jgi:hypothetical protein